MDTETVLKKCFICKEWLPLILFPQLTDGTPHPYCRQCRNKHHNEWRFRRDPEDRNAELADKRRRGLDDYAKLRSQVIEAYGGKCARCDNATPEFLAIDHVDHTKKPKGDGGVFLYRRLRKEGFPRSNYQLLCHNCNYLKELQRREDRFQQMLAAQVPRVKEAHDYHLRLRAAILNAYGCYCACCGATDPNTLSLDHVNGGGNAHRRTVKGKSRGVYQWLRNQGFPRDGFQILCHNCNYAKRCYGACPHQRLYGFENKPNGSAPVLVVRCRVDGALGTDVL